MARRFKPWSERITAAEKRGKFTDREIDIARSWTTCAVGEKRNYSEAIMKLDNDAFDKFMETQECKLGLSFSWAVDAHDFTNAERLYEEIMALP